MIARKIEHIKLKSSGMEYEINVGFPVAYRMIGVELHRKSLQKGDFAI